MLHFYHHSAMSTRAPYDPSLQVLQRSHVLLTVSSAQRFAHQVAFGNDCIHVTAISIAKRIKGENRSEMDACSKPGVIAASRRVAGGVGCVGAGHRCGKNGRGQPCLQRARRMPGAELAVRRPELLLCLCGAAGAAGAARAAGGRGADDGGHHLLHRRQLRGQSIRRADGNDRCRRQAHVPGDRAGRGRGTRFTPSTITASSRPSRAACR